MRVRRLLVSTAVLASAATAVPAAAAPEDGDQTFRGTCSWIGERAYSRPIGPVPTQVAPVTFVFEGTGRCAGLLDGQEVDYPRGMPARMTATGSIAGAAAPRRCSPTRP